MSSEIFDIPDVSNRICQIKYYQLGHSSLTIVIRPTKQDRQLFLRFIDVRYIEAPISWIGAEFHAKNAEASLKFALSLGIRGIKSGSLTLFGARVNRRQLIYPNKLRNFIFPIYMNLLSLSPFSNYKHNFVYILARQMVLDFDQDTMDE